MKVYDSEERRLEFYEEATHEFWDNHWKSKDIKKDITSCKKHWILKYVKKYLPKGSRILEGGCGKGQIVYCLESNQMVIKLFKIVNKPKTL